MARMPGAPFIPPASFSPGRPSGPVRFIVIHCTDNVEGVTAAENGASYDSRRTDGVSAHFLVDANSWVQEVDTADRAHGSLYHGNLWGIQIEVCGYASQSRAAWLDAISRPTILNTARICAWALATHGLPLVRLVDSQVRAGRGITSHGDITRGFPEDSGTHTDPGPNFPWDVLFSDISALLGGDDMTPDQDAMLTEVHRLLYEGKRTNDPQTAGGGVPIAWLPRVVREIELALTATQADVDAAEAAVLAAIAAVPAGNPDVLATAIVAKLGPAQAQALLDAMAARLAT